MIEFPGYTRKKNKNRGLEMTSLIDMVFLLLIFFLLTSYYTKPTIPVTLPESQSAGFHKDGQVVLVVREDGLVLIDNEFVTEDEILSILSYLLRISPEKDVHIQADEGVDFGIIVNLMDTAHQAGAKDIFFVVEKEKADE
jgi:biopolymer transport protein ExbD